jgi:hypothetical protein
MLFPCALSKGIGVLPLRFPYGYSGRGEREKGMQVCMREIRSGEERYQVGSQNIK